MEINPEQLIRDLNSEDEVGLLLRGHLYIEAELVRLIEQGFMHKKKFDVGAINFPKKIYLAYAMGRLAKDEVDSYVYFNKLRNKLAHNLGVALTEENVRGLVESFNEKQLLMLTQAMEAQPERQLGLRDCILILFMYLHTLTVEGEGALLPEAAADNTKRDP